MSSSLHLVFMDSNTIGGRLIRMVTWGKWSHVGILSNDFSIYDSKLSCGGVVKADLGDRLSQYRKHCVVELPVDDAGVIRAVHSQLGKPYDFSAVFGIPFHRNWQEEDKWFCSELVAWACAQGGFPVINKPFGRVTPQDLYETVTILGKIL